MHLNSILGFEFGHKSEPFAIDALIEAITCFSFEVIQSFIISYDAHFIYISIVGILGMLFSLSTFFFEFSEPTDKSPETSEIETVSKPIH